jgi:pimeloyl-ACP methyl ester carboxylesterase
VWISVADRRISDAHLARRLEAEPAVVVRAAEEHGHGPSHIVCTAQQLSHQLAPDALAVTSRRDSERRDRWSSSERTLPGRSMLWWSVLAADRGAHMQHVEVAGLRIAFEQRGAGPTLVLLHGAVCDSRGWRVELESFSDAYTVVAWDAPGCGDSSDPPDSFRMADFAACLAALIEALDAGPSHVLGHSWGSTLALELYLRRPDLVRGLVLVGAYAGWAGSLPPDEVERRLAFAMQAADRPEDFAPASMPGLFSDVMPADRARELATIMSDIRPAGTRTMAQALAEADLRDALPRIDVPTLLVYGDADQRSPLDVAEALHRSIAGSTLAVLPGLGHECYIESAAAFGAVVRTFLAAQD